MTRWPRSGDLTVDPDPVPEGKEIGVDYQGKGTLYYRVDFGPWQKVPVDPKTGKAKVRAPRGSTIVAFSNLEFPSPTEAVVDVLSSQP